MTRTDPILLVNKNDQDASLLQKFLKQEGYETTVAKSLSDIDSTLDESGDYELAIVDADGFPPQLWNRCKQLQQEGIPFFVLSLKPDQVRSSRDEGEQDLVLEKPLGKHDLLDLITSITE